MPAPVPIGSRRTTQHGYVLIKIAPGKWDYEHRVVWQRERGPLPLGYTVHHINENKTDNRPENLELCESNADHFRRFHGATSAENGRRGAVKTRGRPQTPEHRAKRGAARRGKKYPALSAALTGRTFSEETIERMRAAARERPPRYKLTTADTERLRSLYASGEYSQTDLAGIFGIGQTTVSRLLRITH